jgi:hypothetical protein
MKKEQKEMIMMALQRAKAVVDQNEGKRFWDEHGHVAFWEGKYRGMMEIVKIIGFEWE